MKRLVFLNRFFYPDLSATSQVLSDLAFHLAALGEDVHVVTSQQLYYSPRASLPRQEIINNVHIHRVPTTWFGRAGLWGRGIDYASYYGSMWLRARALVGPGDVVIAKTDPPLTSVVAMLVTRERGARLVNWLQDIYPETAAELGVPLMQGLLGRSLGHLRDVSLRSAVANIAVGEQMGKRIRLRGVVPDHVYVIPNWTNDEEVCSLAHEENPLRSEWGLDSTICRRLFRQPRPRPRVRDRAFRCAATARSPAYCFFVRRRRLSVRSACSSGHSAQSAACVSIC